MPNLPAAGRSSAPLFWPPPTAFDCAGSRCLCHATQECLTASSPRPCPTPPLFFSSTTILIIGGLLALMGTTDKAAELVREIPFSQATPILVFEFKILVLIAIFVYAFFRFSWSMRQYTFVALMIGALPSPRVFCGTTRAGRRLRRTCIRHDRTGC
jgi:hypothetical protein